MKDASKEEAVLKKYTAKEIDMGEACRLLKLSPWLFFDLLKKHQTYLNVDLEDLLSASSLTDS